MKCSHRICANSIAAFLVATASTTLAQDTWTGTTDAAWSIDTNWLDGTQPTALDNILFPATIPASGATITLSAGEVGNALTLSDAYTLTGGDLVLTTGNITVDPSITGSITSALGGTVYNKLGTGTLVLGGVNTYTGIMSVTAGTLTVQSAGSLGTAAAGTTVATGATLAMQGGITIAGEALGLTGTLRNASGDNTYGGAITLNAGSAVDTATGTTLIVSTSAVGSGAWTKSGEGTLRFTADPNQTGPLTLAAGVLELNHSGAIDFNSTVQAGATLRAVTAAIGDAVDVTLQAGALLDFRVSDTMGGLAGDGTVTKGNTGAGTLTVNNGGESTVFGGIVENGLGTVSLNKSGSGVLTLTGTNIYTGGGTINGGNILVSGAAGRLSGGGVYVVGDNNGNDESLTLGATAEAISGTLDRVADTGGIRFNGTVPVTYNGAAAGGATQENMGSLDFAVGAGIFTVNPAAGGEVQINSGPLLRQNGNATGVIRGVGLGLAAGTADSSRVFFSSAPATIGSGGTGPSASIIPFLLGGSSSTAAANTFVRYDAINGVTPLAGGDYASSVAGSTGLNVTTAGEIIASDSGVNALRVTGGSTTLAGSDVDLTLRSGAVLFTTASSTIDGAGMITLGDGLVNGTGVGGQGLIYAAADGTAITATISANLGTAGGLVIGDTGSAANVFLLSGNNEITGGIVLNNGILRLGSAGALNDNFFNELTLRAGNSAITGATSTALQLNGNSVSVVVSGNDRLQGSTRIQNASATPATLTIVANAPSDGNDGVLENGTGGGALSLMKRGTSRLQLEQNNPYTGTTDVQLGELRLTGTTGRLSGTSGITIRTGGILYYNQQSDQNIDRLNDAAAINMHQGFFQADQTQSAFNNAQISGALNILNGNNTITTDFALSGNTQTLTFASLNGAAGRAAAGSAVNFQGFNTTGDIGIGEGNSRNRVVFTATPVNTAGGILGGNAYHTKDFNTAATQDVVNFARYAADVDTVVAGNQASVAAFAAYSTGTQDLWTATTVANPAADVVLNDNRSIEAIRLGGGIDAALGGFTLNLSQGGIILNGVSAAISGGTLTAGDAAGGELAIRVDDNLTTSILTVSAVIADTGVTGPVSLLKTGADNLTLSGINTYTGRTTLQGGAVNITADENLGAAPATATASHLRLYGATLSGTAATGSTTLSSNRGLELGGGGSTISQAVGGNLIYNPNAIISNGDSGLTLTGNVDMAVGSAITVGGSLNVLGGASAATVSTVSLSGSANTIGYSLVVGNEGGQANFSYSTPGGVLNIGSSNPTGSNLDVATKAGAVGADTVGIADLTGLSLLTANVSRVRVGAFTADVTGGTVRGELLLPQSADIFAGIEVLVGEGASLGPGMAGIQNRLVFGSGVTNLTTPLMVIGGKKGTGSATVSAGGTLNYSGVGSGTGDLILARNNVGTGVTSVGTLNAADGTLIADLDEIIVGLKSGGTGVGGATGTLTLGAAAHRVTANSLILGSSSGDATGVASGALSIAGGTLSVRDNVTLGLFAGNAGSGAGLLNITGGAVTVGGNIVTTNSASATATLTLEGGALDMTGGNISADTFNLRAGSLANVAQVFTGDGATPATVEKTGVGTASFTGTNAYTGATNVSAGTLLVNGSLTGSVVNVSVGVLGGTGSITGAVTVGDGTNEDDATLSAGVGIGTLSTGGVTFASDGAFTLQINTTTPATDLLSSSGAVTLGLGIASLNVFDLGSGLLAAGESFTFISAVGGVTGNFAGLAQGAELTVGSNVFTIDYAPNSVALVAVPEPGTFATLLAGMGALAALQRFRRRTR